MQLSKIRIRNYRLLIDAELEVDPKTTLIVGRNNTAKTSCFVCIGNVLEGKNISFNDYPLLKREDFYTKIALFMEKKLSYEDLWKLKSRRFWNSHRRYRNITSLKRNVIS